MYEIIIENRQTLEMDIIYGRNVKNAFERAKLNAYEWNVLGAEYID